MQEDQNGIPFSHYPKRDFKNINQFRYSYFKRKAPLFLILIIAGGIGIALITWGAGELRIEPIIVSLACFLIPALYFNSVISKIYDTEVQLQDNKCIIIRKHIKTEKDYKDLSHMVAQPSIVMLNSYIHPKIHCELTADDPRQAARISSFLEEKGAKYISSGWMV